jgi:predicted transcriptional regulator
MAGQCIHYEGDRNCEYLRSYKALCRKATLPLKKAIYKMIITKRDRMILQELNNGILTTSQIAILFLLSKKKAATRMKKLHSSGLVKRIPNPFSNHHGRPEFIYYISGKGKAELPNNKGSVLTDPAKNIYLIPHRLLIRDIQTAFYQAASSDYTAKLYYPSNLGITSDELNGLIPDSIVSIEKLPTGKKILHYIEADCGSEPIRSSRLYSLENKYEKYIKLFDSTNTHASINRALNYTYKGFRVLMVMTSETRLNQVNEIASKQKAEFIWVTCSENINPDILEAPVWRNYKHKGLSLTSVYPKDKCVEKAGEKEGNKSLGCLLKSKQNQVGRGC